MAVLGGLSEGAFSVVFRAAGVCLLTQIVADTCRDAGEEGLGQKVMLAGRVAVMTLMLPVMNALVGLLMQLA